MGGGERPEEIFADFTSLARGYIPVALRAEETEDVIELAGTYLAERLLRAGLNSL